MDTERIGREITERLQPFLREMEREQHNRLEAAARADPARYKMSLLIERGKDERYRYYGDVRNGRGSLVRFCYAINRNIAGYYLGWREVETKAQIKRDKFVARKQRKAVRLIARQRFQKMKGEKS